MARVLLLGTVVSLVAAGCGAGSWKAQGRYNARGASLGTCATALSPDETSERVICHVPGHAYSCWEPDGRRLDSTAGFDADPDCKRALSAVTQAKLLP
jgi:hypothetical protein